MTTETNKLTPVGCEGAIRHFRESIAQGKHWFMALLEAVGMCEATEDVYDGRRYSFYIAGEAFDWLTMAERLCQRVAELLPQDEKNSLLFEERLPLALSAKEFKELIGARKYRQYLNYFYGVTVESALIQKVSEEVRKERLSQCLPGNFDAEGQAYRHLYGKEKPELLSIFRREKGFPNTHRATLTELKEFTYWLFKHRVRNAEPAKIASDTRKALGQLKARGFLAKPSHPRRKIVPLDTSS